MRHDTEPPRPSIFDTLKERHPVRAASPEARPLPKPSRLRRPPMFRPVGRSPRSTAGLVAVIVALFAFGGLGILSLYSPPAERVTEATREQGFPHAAAEPGIEASPRASALQEDPVAGPSPVGTEDVRESQGDRVAALDPPAVPPTIEPRSKPAERPAPVRGDPEPSTAPKPGAVAAQEAPRGAVVDDRPAVKVFSARPDYPEAARLAGIAGTVILEAEVDTAGSVASTRVLRGVSPELDQAAREAVERWRFEPATSNGEPRSDLYRAAIHFELKPSTEPEAEVASIPKEGSAPSSEPEAAVASLPEEGEFEPPVRLYAPPPTYPPGDWVAAVEGDVVVKAAISQTGRVTGVEILQGLSSGLNRAAIEALKHWRFRPATRQGEAVAAHQVFTFRFAR